MSALRYDWWGRLADLSLQRAPSSFRVMSDVIAFGEWFTIRYGDWAEDVGIQPAHILRFPKGLAWRVASCWKSGHWSVLCFPRRYHLVADVSEWLMVYRFEPDGSVSPVFGGGRAEVLGAAIEPLRAQDPQWLQSARIQTQADG